jgi:hypothetical protein
MKRILWSTLGLAAVCLAGCVVTSVYPYYTVKDLTFDPILLGIWSDPTDTNVTKATWTFEKLGAQNYSLLIRDDNKTNAFDAHLFTLGNAKFLDLLPRERLEYQTPSHLLLHVAQLHPQLELRLLNYGWLSKLVEEKPKAIRHIIVPKESGSAEDGLLTLTADTAELQKFIRKQLHNTNAWVEPMVLKKQ